jgi:hypothetical protein
MHFFYKFDNERNLVMTTVTGVVTMADPVSYQAKLLEDPEFDPSFSQLMDVTQVASIELTNDKRSDFRPWRG